MMTPYAKFKDQVQRNLVALISLFIAVTSLSYNTWRNEKSEYNRNQREASFHLLLHLGDFRELLYHLEYDPETLGEEAFRSGWVSLLAVEELAMLLEPPLPESATTLKGAWANWERLLDRGAADDRRDALDQLKVEMDSMRDLTLEKLMELD